MFMKGISATFQKWFIEWADEDAHWNFNKRITKSMDLYCDFYSGKF